jgi:hypothetical protein
MIGVTVLGSLLMLPLLYAHDATGSVSTGSGTFEGTRVIEDGIVGADNIATNVAVPTLLDLCVSGASGAAPSKSKAGSSIKQTHKQLSLLLRSLCFPFFGIYFSSTIRGKKKQIFRHLVYMLN